MLNYVFRWVKTGVTKKVFEVRIENLYNSYYTPSSRVDVDTKQDDHGPLLVVFSNDKRRRKGEQRELHELFVHSDLNEDTMEDYDDGDDDNAKYGGEIEYQKYHQRRRYRRDVHRQTLSENYTRNIYASKTFFEPNQNETTVNGSKRSRTKRRTRQKERHYTCRRKPLYVNFEDINWHTWIIAPEGYEVRIILIC